MPNFSILRLFQAAVADHACGVAAVDGAEAITYRELDAASDRLARQLRGSNVDPGHLVPIIAHRSIPLIVAVIGVLKAGAAYTLIDENNPAKRRKKIVEQCGCPVSLATRSDSTDLGGVAVHGAGETADTDIGSDVFRALADHGTAAYVVFTSGTTGTPKGVIIDDRALTALVKWHNERFEMNSTSRTTLLCGVGFDVLQWEIWSSLCAGATVHILDQRTRVSPAALLTFYAEHRITHAYVPTVLVPDVVGLRIPERLALQYLFCAGEKLNPVATDHLPYTVIDYYGPTEATIFATCRVMEPGSENRTPSIGSAISDTEVFILDNDLGDVMAGAPGELCLAGTCLALGYLGDSDLTQQRFVWSSRHDRRIYRTGDLGRWLADGTIEFLGRQDDQVKIRGYRIELGEIETAILGNRYVKQAVALVDDSESAKRLVAFIVPHDVSTDPDGLIRAVRAHVRDELPDYMQPGIYHSLPSLPLTSNSKIDRTALRKIMSDRRDEPSQISGFDDELERGIAQAWRNALGHGRFTATDSFFEVGGYSLLATALVDDISRRTGIRAYIWDFYGDPTIRGLAAALRQRETAPLVEGEPIRELAEDIYLPDGVDFTGGFHARQLTAPANIMVTGVTGVIGVHLLERLLNDTDAVVHCPVRADTTALAYERLRRVVARYELDIADWARVRVYAGDLAEPRLGLAEQEYVALARDIDVIYHSASAANFIQSYAYMRRDNVEGLRRLIRLAADDHVKPLLLVSSISVYSWGHLFTGKTTMYEDDDIDQNLRAVATDLGYMRSKWVMEKILQLAASQGLPVMAFRLGYATCHSRTGHAATYQWWPRLVKTCVALGAVPDLRNLREGLTTIDYIVDTMAAIGRQPDALGKNFNIIPDRERIVTLQGFFQLMEKYFGYKFRIIPFTEWVQLWKDDPQAPLYPLLSMFNDRVLDGKSTIELYQNTYRWGKQNVTNHLAGTGIEEPTFTKEILERYLGHVLAEPYIPMKMIEVG
ncbi:amino acid adenylation domain-containing protein [Nocardia acidivorans]|uniref:amino acid adenylation domain-containing protein n=1 Tax=Nocardia acidivorans TaxID=404580 RepID=UPI000837A7B9|nr:amino acid adenylation domain-containing protein [Nocardia acidivorans]